MQPKNEFRGAGVAGSRPSPRLQARGAGGRRRVRLLGLLPLGLLPLAGCEFLANEFAWLDRASPAVLQAPDLPPSGVRDRP